MAKVADYRRYVSSYLTVADITKPVTLTIKTLRAEEVGQDRDEKAVALFEEEPRKLVLNNTRVQALTDIFGDADVDGKKITLDTARIRGVTQIVILPAKEDDDG